MPEALTRQHSPSLADIEDEIALIDDMIASTPPEMQSELYQRKEQLVRVELPRKVDAIANYLRRCQAMQRVAAEVRDRAIEGIRLWTKREDDLRNLVKSVMQVTGTRSYKGAISCITLRPPAESVEVYSMRDLPLEYCKPMLPPKLEPNKALIAQALKGGIEVPGARLIEGDDVLQVR